MEHEDRADELEREVDKLEQHSEQVGRRIEDTRSEWKSKQQDQAVPGAQMSEREESDQLLEDEQSTGNPDAAGTEE